MKKVLIITYYWPPAGGPGVQRILKFVKYLPEFGWEPIILTVAKGEFPAIDESLHSEIPAECLVYKTRHLEPNIMYKSFTGMKTDDPIPIAVMTEKDKNWRKRFAHFIRLNFFIPDAKILWLPFAMHAVRHIIATHAPDLILSSSPPPSVHLIARRIKRKYGLRWIADLRDPWTDIYSMQLSQKNKFTRRFEHRLEKKVLKSADQITTVSRVLAQKFAEKIGDDRKTHVIPNGFDPDDFPNRSLTHRSDKFTLLHVGKLSAMQNPTRLIETLDRMLITDATFRSEFQFILVGHLASDLRNLIRKSRIYSNVTEIEYVEHKKAIQYMQNADLLLLIIPDTPDNRGIITGKVFEYMASRRPILCIGPHDSDLKELFEISTTGEICSYDQDPEPFIKKYYDLWHQDRLPLTPTENIQRFSRKELTGELVSLFTL